MVGIWGDMGYKGVVRGDRFSEDTDMGMVEIRDHALWVKHIHENEPLKEKLSALPAGSLVELEVNGLKGTWKKMDDGKDGRPTPGVKAVGKARDHWHALQEDRGELVTIRDVRSVTLEFDG